MDKKMRFALIGAGNVATKYVAAFANIEDAELVGVVARNQDRLAAFVAEHGIEYRAGTLSGLLDQTDIDAVIVCTPSGSHSACTIEAAGFGKHVLCEKPLDITIEKIDAMTRACEESGVKLGCTYQHRTAQHNMIVRDLVRTGKLGRIFIVNAFLKNYRSQEYYESGGGWRGTWELDGGGPFMQQAAHTVDLVVWMMGPAVRVTAMTKTAAHRIEVEDMGHAIVEYENGAQGVLEASTVVKPGYPNKIEIHAEKGTIVLGESGIEVWDVDDIDRPEIEASGTASGSADPMAIGSEGHERIVRDFIGAVKEDRPPLADPASARISVELILSIYAAARRN
ncbi:MAG: Gfo/Idh/MocA family oxidoreductase [Candidatus Hydrogenedentes bacterium]|nr:Gfo/Idh/MocA family oxidoreductase [Candidatus Hydrogenedentota bacterium]